MEARARDLLLYQRLKPAKAVTAVTVMATIALNTLAASTGLTTSASIASEPPLNRTMLSAPIKASETVSLERTALALPFVFRSTTDTRRERPIDSGATRPALLASVQGR